MHGKTNALSAKEFFSGKNGLLLLLALASFAAALPFLVGMYVFTAEFHSVPLRAFELNSCLKDGVLFPRWSPDLYGGKGAPLFNFYAPFAYYLVQIPVLLGIGGFATAVHLVYALSMIASLFGAFLLARKFSSGKGALVAAVFYAFFTYHFTDVFLRGAFSESVAYAILPFAAFFLLEALDGRRLAAAAVALALLVLAHSPLSLLFAVVFIPYVCAKAVLEGKKKVFVVSVLLGLGLSAVFWVPALAERDYVSLERTDLSQIKYEQGFDGNFMSLDGFATLPEGAKNLFQVALVDSNFTDGFIPRNNFVESGVRQLDHHVGLLYSLLILAGLVYAFFFSRKKMLLEAVFVVLVLFFLTSFSAFLWFSFLRQVQFPWRLLPLLALFAVPLVAGLAEKLGKRAAAVLCLLLVVFSFSLAIPIEYFRSPLSFYDSQITSETVSSLNNDLSYFGEYAPSGAKWDAVLQEPFVEHGLGSANQSCYEMTASVDATEKSWVVLNLFRYPNWVLEVDGRQVPLTQNELGMIMFQVDAGKHNVSVHFEETPVEKAAWAASIISLLLILALAIWPQKAQAFFESAAGSYQKILEKVKR